MLEQRRGKNIALTGLVLQLGAALVMTITWQASGSLSALSCTLFLAGGLPLWLMIAALFYCRELAGREAAELEEIAAQAGASTAIFESDQAGELRRAAARLRFMERWGSQIFTLLWAAYHVAMGILILRYLAALSVRGQPLANAAMLTLISILVAFVSFLFSRYATGMASQAEWRMLRASGSYLLAAVLAVAAVGGALLANNQGYLRPDWILAGAIPIVQFILGAELVLNLVLDIYRPRVPGQEQRPSFDSRLLNLLSEPGKVGHSLAETINYQFGFEVSRTWFYQLLSRALVPLLIAGALVIFALTSVVTVADGEQCIVRRWGRIRHGRDGRPAIRTPGLHLKLPWPIETAQRFRTDAVHAVLLGAGRKRLVEDESKRLYLWTKEHGEHEELDFVIAVPPKEEATSRLKGERPPPPVNIIKLVVVLHYRVADMERYLFRFADSRAALEALAWREMVRYCASATLDEPAGGVDRPEAIMTYGKDAAEAELQRRIERRAGPEGLDLGVEIVNVGLLSVHPPAKAAPAYEKVLEAERRRDEKRYEAEAVGNQRLIEVAGRPETALGIVFALDRAKDLEDLQRAKDAPEEFGRIVADRLRGLADDRASLEALRARSRLLGKATDMLDAQLAARGTHLAMLGRVQAAPKTFDYAGEMARARAEAERLLDAADGQVAAILAEAEGHRWATEFHERSRAESFPRELMAYRASPSVFLYDRYLSVWDRILPDVPAKYILGMGDAHRLEMWLDLKQEPGLMQGVLDSEKD